MRPRAKPFRTWGSSLILDPAAQAYIDRWSAPPPTPVLIIINNLIIGLKADGPWALQEDLVLPIFNQPTREDAALNLKSTLYTSSFVNNPGYAQGVPGFVFNGTTNYIRSGFAPSISSLFQPTSNHFMNWITAGGTGADTNKRSGSCDATNANCTAIFGLHSASSPRGNTNQAAQISGFLSGASRLGMTSANQTLLAARQLYRDGVSIGTSAASGQTRTGRETYIGAFNNNGVVTGFCDNTYSGWSMGASLTAPQHLALFNRLAAAAAAMAPYYNP